MDVVHIFPKALLTLVIFIEFGAASNHVVPVDYYPSPIYQNGVQDYSTGDLKLQAGDQVKGSYTVADPTDSQRNIRYTDDKFQDRPAYPSNQDSNNDPNGYSKSHVNIITYLNKQLRADPKNHQHNNQDSSAYTNPINYFNKPPTHLVAYPYKQHQSTDYSKNILDLSVHSQQQQNHKLVVDSERDEFIREKIENTTGESNRGINQNADLIQELKHEENPQILKYRITQTHHGMKQNSLKDSAVDNYSQHHAQRLTPLKYEKVINSDGYNGDKIINQYNNYKGSSLKQPQISKLIPDYEISQVSTKSIPEVIPSSGYQNPEIIRSLGYSNPTDFKLADHQKPEAHSNVDTIQSGDFHADQEYSKNQQNPKDRQSGMNRYHFQYPQKTDSNGEYTEYSSKLESPESSQFVEVSKYIGQAPIVQFAGNEYLQLASKPEKIAGFLKVSDQVPNTETPQLAGDVGFQHQGLSLDARVSKYVNLLQNPGASQLTGNVNNLHQASNPGIKYFAKAPKPLSFQVAENEKYLFPQQKFTNNLGKVPNSEDSQLAGDVGFQHQGLSPDAGVSNLLQNAEASQLTGNVKCLHQASNPGVKYFDTAPKPLSFQVTENEEYLFRQQNAESSKLHNSEVAHHAKYLSEAQNFESEQQPEPPGSLKLEKVHDFSSSPIEDVIKTNAKYLQNMHNQNQQREDVKQQQKYTIMVQKFPPDNIIHESKPGQDLQNFEGKTRDPHISLQLVGKVESQGEKGNSLESQRLMQQELISNQSPLVESGNSFESQRQLQPSQKQLQLLKNGNSLENMSQLTLEKGNSWKNQKDFNLLPSLHHTHYHQSEKHGTEFQRNAASNHEQRVTSQTQFLGYPHPDKLLQEQQNDYSQSDQVKPLNELHQNHMEWKLLQNQPSSEDGQWIQNQPSLLENSHSLNQIGFGKLLQKHNHKSEMQRYLASNHQEKPQFLYPEHNILEEQMHPMRFVNLSRQNQNRYAIKPIEPYVSKVYPKTAPHENVLFKYDQYMQSKEEDLILQQHDIPEVKSYKPGNQVNQVKYFPRKKANLKLVHPVSDLEETADLHTQIKSIPQELFHQTQSESTWRPLSSKLQHGTVAQKPGQNENLFHQVKYQRNPVVQPVKNIESQVIYGSWQENPVHQFSSEGNHALRVLPAAIQQQVKSENSVHQFSAEGNNALRLSPVTIQQGKSENHLHQFSAEGNRALRLLPAAIQQQGKSENSVHQFSAVGNYALRHLPATSQQGKSENQVHEFLSEGNHALRVLPATIQQGKSENHVHPFSIDALRVLPAAIQQQGKSENSVHQFYADGNQALRLLPAIIQQGNPENHVHQLSAEGNHALRLLPAAIQQQGKSENSVHQFSAESNNALQLLTAAMQKGKSENHVHPFSTENNHALRLLSEEIQHQGKSENPVRQFSAEDNHALRLLPATIHQGKSENHVHQFSSEGNHALRLLPVAIQQQGKSENSVRQFSAEDNHAWRRLPATIQQGNSENLVHQFPSGDNHASRFLSAVLRQIKSEPRPIKSFGPQVKSEGNEALQGSSSKSLYRNPEYQLLQHQESQGKYAAEGNQLSEQISPSAEQGRMGKYASLQHNQEHFGKSGGQPLENQKYSSVKIGGLQENYFPQEDKLFSHHKNTESRQKYAGSSGIYMHRIKPADYRLRQQLSLNIQQGEVVEHPEISQGKYVGNNYHQATSEQEVKSDFPPLQDWKYSPAKTEHHQQYHNADHNDNSNLQNQNLLNYAKTSHLNGYGNNQWKVPMSYQNVQELKFRRASAQSPQSPKPTVDTPLGESPSAINKQPLHVGYDNAAVHLVRNGQQLKNLPVYLHESPPKYHQVFDVMNLP